LHPNSTTIRVRYAETDQMGVAYYGAYAAWLEVGRVEFLRMNGTSYRKLENEGVMLPVLNLNISYRSPALYDDLLEVRTRLEEFSGTRISFEHEVLNESDKLLANARVELVFMDRLSRRPIRVPKKLAERLSAGDQ
jgi:acyl-CoA thioester hydrolase